MVNYVTYKIIVFRYWYNKLPFGHRCMFFASIGNIIGCSYGTHKRLKKEAFKESDCLTMTTYRVDPDNHSAFELQWNDQATLCQRKRGYEWTTMLKSMALESTPFSYVAFRMWDADPDFALNTLFDSVYSELNGRMEDLGVVQKVTKYRPIVDDSVRRWIP